MIRRIQQFTTQNIPVGDHWRPGTQAARSRRCSRRVQKAAPAGKFRRQAVRQTRLRLPTRASAPRSRSPRASSAPFERAPFDRDAAPRFEARAPHGTDAQRSPFDRSAITGRVDHKASGNFAPRKPGVAPAAGKGEFKPQRVRARAASRADPTERQAPVSGLKRACGSRPLFAWMQAAPRPAPKPVDHHLHRHTDAVVGFAVPGARRPAAACARVACHADSDQLVATQTGCWWGRTAPNRRLAGRPATRRGSYPAPTVRRSWQPVGSCRRRRVTGHRGSPTRSASPHPGGARPPSSAARSRGMNQLPSFSVVLRRLRAFFVAFAA